MSKNKVYRQNDEECLRYMNSIRDIREIEGEEWDRLTLDLMSHDKAVVVAARERLIMGCLPLVVRIATRYDYLEERGVKRIDLIGAGNLMLTEVVNRLMSPLPVTLEAYMVTWIRKGITKARDRYLGRESIQGTDDDAEDDEEKEATAYEVEELADEEKTANIVRGGYRWLDATLDDDTQTTRADLQISDDEADKRACRSSAHKEMVKLLNKYFPYEEAGIVYDIFLSLQPLTIGQCAKKYGLTPRQVRSVRESAITRLQMEDCRDTLREYLHYCVA